MVMSLEAVTPSLVLGEGPHWDQESQMLYLVDIKSSTVYRYHPDSNKLTSITLDAEIVSFVLPVEGQKDHFAVSVGRNLAKISWDGVSAEPSNVEKLTAVNTDGNKFNDAKADSTGRLWIGTLAPESAPGVFLPGKASFYSVGADHKAHTQLVGVTISNGMAWSSDNKCMYYIDTQTGKVEGFDFDAVKGEISNRRTVFDFRANDVLGLPDGMTIDAEGKLWVACFGGAQVIRVDPDTGKLMSQVPIPAPQVTSVAFGGKNLDDLYVTTANLRLSEEDKLKYPQAGFTFKVSGLGVKGFPGQAVKF